MGRLPKLSCPLRTRQYPLGLPANTAEEQEHRDRGTCMAYRSFNFARTMTERGRRRGLLPPVTIEQPAIPEDSLELPSAYLLASGQAWLLDPSVQTAELNSCVYGLRSLKAEMWSGTLKDMREGMSKQCTCPLGTRHVTLRGGPRTAPAGKYPDRLLEQCSASGHELARRVGTRMGRSYRSDQTEGMGNPRTLVQPTGQHKYREAPEVHSTSSRLDFAAGELAANVPQNRQG